jgi:hypothetical protein
MSLAQNSTAVDRAARISVNHKVLRQDAILKWLAIRDGYSLSRWDIGDDVSGVRRRSAPARQQERITRTFIGKDDLT